MPNLDSIQPNPNPVDRSAEETSVPIRRISSDQPSRLTGDQTGAPSERTSEQVDDPLQPEVKRPIEEMEEHTIGFVLKQSLYIIFQPKASFEDLKEERAIGRPMGVMLLLGVLFLILQLVLFYSNLAQISEGNGLLQYLFPPIGAFSPSQIFYLFAILVVVWVSQLIGFWSLAVLVTDVTARWLGGRGSWSTFAVSALYWMIASWAVVVPLSVVVGLILTRSNLWWFLATMLLLLGLLWIGIVLARGVSVQYGLSTLRSSLAVFLPALLLFFGFMVASVLVPPLDAETAAADNPTSAVNANNSIAGNLNTNANAATKVNSNQNGNLNTNLNVNSSSSINEALPGFYQVDATVLEELTNEKRKELARVSEVGTDQVRAEQLIEMKYDLKLYFSVFERYPTSNGVEKLDGRSDSLNLALEDFYGSRRSFVDPQYPSYYYSYESDGKTFRLTGFNATTQQPQTISEQD